MLRRFPDFLYDEACDRVPGGVSWIIRMQGLSNDEIRNKHYPPFQVDLSSLMKRMNELEPMTLTQIFSGIFKGSMPRLYENENVDRDLPRRSPFICSNFVCRPMIM